MAILQRKNPSQINDLGSILAERVGFEPTVPLPVRLISSQVHSTTLPPLRVLAVKTPDYARTCPHVNEQAGEGWAAVAAGAG